MPEDPQPIRLAVRTNARGIPEAYDVDSGRPIARVFNITHGAARGGLASVILSAWCHAPDGSLAGTPSREPAADRPERADS